MNIEIKTLDDKTTTITNIKRLDIDARCGVVVVWKESNDIETLELGSIAKISTFQPKKPVTIRRKNGEWRVPSPDGKEEGAYYTDNKLDAYNTALSMYGQGADIRFH